MKKLLISSLLVVAAGVFAQGAQAADAACKVTLEGNDQMKFDLDHFDISKKACPEFTVELKHVGKLPKAAMGHNVVVAKTADVEAISNDGIAAGVDKNYVKPEDDRVIAHTDLIGGGEDTSVTFKTDGLEVGGDYEFFCSFPGHHAMMKGKVNVTE